MATIQQRKGPNGTTVYRVQVRRKGQPAQSATFTKITDARKWATATEGAIISGRHFKPIPQHTVADMIDRYLAEVLPHKRASTIPNQTRHLRWWRQKLGYAMLADVTPAMVAECREELVQTFSGATANRYLAALSHAFTVAVKEWGWVSDNPCRKLRRMREPRGRVRFLSDDERHRLLTECRASRNPYLYDVVILALSTGARKGELLGLSWRDVDLARGFLTFVATKNGDRRSVPLTGHAAEVMQQRAIGKLNGLVFPGRGGLTRLDDGWRGAVKRAGLVDFRFHDLRHTAASYMAMGGASLAEIAEVLGHRSLEVTRRYAHLSQDHTRAVVARMNQAMFGSGQD